jgi:hypothetical protein
VIAELMTASTTAIVGRVRLDLARQQTSIEEAHAT